MVLLTGAATYSAAEDFTGAFRSINRGKVFGGVTGGSTGQPVSFNLPGGGGRVCAKRDYRWDGTEFVGIGITPDVVVNPTLKGVVASKDEVLDAAVNFLATQKILQQNNCWLLVVFHPRQRPRVESFLLNNSRHKTLVCTCKIAV